MENIAAKTIVSSSAALYFLKHKKYLFFYFNRINLPRNGFNTILLWLLFCFFYKTKPALL